MRRKIVVSMIVMVLSALLFTNLAFADYYSDKTLLKQGMRGDAVKQLQQDLDIMGYYYYNYATGYFGSITTKSVMSYQKSRGLSVDGLVGPQTARQLKVDNILQWAKWHMGVPYVWGGASSSGFDCSGFTSYILSQNDIVIPRTAKEQWNVGTWVDKSQLKPGDLVFFTTYTSGPSHVGFYLGNNQFIHASSGAGKVLISDLNNSYYLERYIGGKRIVN